MRIRRAGGVMSRVRSAVLTLGAVAGALCLVTAIAAAGFGVKPLVFRSGSMGPTIPTGALGLARSVPAADLDRGDVVSVIDADGTRVTHRIVTIDRRPGGSVLVLRGDANRLPDVQAYEVARADRVFLHVRGLGRVVAWLSGLPAVFIGGVLVGVLLMLAFARRPAGGPATPTRGPPVANEPPPRPTSELRPADATQARTRTRAKVRSPGSQHRKTVGASALSLLLLMIPVSLDVGPLHSVPTMASFADASTATSSFAAHTVPPAATFTCGALGIASVTFNWSAVAEATSYTLHYGTAGASTSTRTGLTATLVTSVNGGTAWIVANNNYGSVTWSSVASVTRTYTIVLGLLSVCS